MNTIKAVAGVYCLINVLNYKKYIGSSVNMRQRYYSHQSALRRQVCCNQYLQNAWNKYGERAFRFYVLEECPLTECFQREQTYIDLFDTTNRKVGYNRNPQASGGICTPEAKAKFSRAMQAKFKSGYRSGFTGKRHTEESRRRLRLGSVNKGARTPEAIRRVLEASNRACYKPVVQLSVSGEFIRQHKSIKAAAVFVGTNRLGIGLVCRGVQNRVTAGGFRWRYAE